MRFQDLAFHWPDGTPLVEGLDLSLEGGRISALLGPSGCGKSSLLRLAAGLLEGSGCVDAPAAKAFVFQQPTLLPWRSVRENVALPLELGARAGAPIDEVLASVDLGEAAELLPRQLSGGMQMRASLARALVTRPELMLLDEPFAALDALTRRRLQRRFEELQRAQGFTTLLVTHDIDEAVLLADRVLVLSGPPVRVRLDLDLTVPRPRRAHDPALAELVTQLEAAL